MDTMHPMAQSDIDILISLFMFCSATSLCKLAQTCRLFRNLILERGEEIAMTRLQITHAGRDRFRALLYEFGGLYVWNSANRFSDVFCIDGEMLVEWQKSIIRDILKLHGRSWIRIQKAEQGRKMNVSLSPTRGKEHAWGPFPAAGGPRKQLCTRSCSNKHTQEANTVGEPICKKVERGAEVF